MFLQAAGRAQQNGNGGGIQLTRDAVAALQHAAQVAAVNQANKLGPHGGGAGVNGSIRPPAPVLQPNLGQGPNQGMSNLHTQAQLQAAMNAQRAAQQGGGLAAANNQAALFLMQNQLAQAQAQAQAANNAAQGGPYLQNNTLAAAAAAAAAVAATTQAAQARAAAVGNANQLLQLQQAAQAAGLPRPQAMAWAQNQALQSAAIAQHNLAQQNLAQNNPALLAAALQAQQARAALQVQQLAAHQQAAAAAAARPMGQSQNNMAAAQQLQVLRQLQARLNAAQAPNALAAAAGPVAAPKPTEAQLQALRTALARSAAGRAALNAANVLGANNPRGGMPNVGNGAGQGQVNPLQQAINLQLLLQQQRNAVQVQQAQAQVNAMANNLAGLQNNAAAAALGSQLAALQQAAMANGQRNMQMQNNAANALAGLNGVGGPNGAGGLNGGSNINEVMLQNLKQMQLAKAMQDSANAAAANGMQSMQGMQQQGGGGGAGAGGGDKASPGGDAAAAAANTNKEQRRLALACVALQLARGGMTVEQAINSGIMGGMSVTDVKFIVECYNAERQRMQGEGSPGVGGPGGQQGPPQQGMPGGGNGGYPGMHGHMGEGGMGEMAQHGIPGMPPGMGYANSPNAAPGSPAGEEHREGIPLGASRFGPGPVSLPTGHASAPVSPPHSGSRNSPIQRGALTAAASEADGLIHETRSEGGASAELAADAAATMAALAKEPFDAFSYAFFGPTETGPGGELLGELETGGNGDGALEPVNMGALEAGPRGPGPLGGPKGPLAALGELPPDQAAWLRAAASANQALWAGEGAEEGPMSNDEIAARLANLDLGSGFF
ncbi:hypothetical protein HYH03_001117 [Edaphochlamys debaryana]|uniref:Uncharacterized protein n=1 Tax=Edaphochlamys debaryana TaxID=47281 RepID=A0A836C6V8_9CHLO|nr:hypothetical protein HYH03_001117 [Edaphochlamys debaryana]|eukprot:KAG2501324.1 hypothetical protein HYH03_001117 [Edaphochlamys debaryana]